jgi:hypothetical protein
MEQEQTQIEGNKTDSDAECKNCLLTALGRFELKRESRQIYLIEPKPGLDHEHIDFQNALSTFVAQTNSSNARIKTLGGMFIIASYNGYKNIKKKVIDTHDAVLTKINIRRFFDCLDRLEKKYPQNYY